MHLQKDSLDPIHYLDRMISHRFLRFNLPEGKLSFVNLSDSVALFWWCWPSSPAQTHYNTCS